MKDLCLKCLNEMVSFKTSSRWIQRKRKKNSLKGLLDVDTNSVPSLRFASVRIIWKPRQWINVVASSVELCRGCN